MHLSGEFIKFSPSVRTKDTLKQKFFYRLMFVNSPWPVHT